MTDAPFIACFDVATSVGCADGRVGAAKPRYWTWELRDGGDTRGARFLQLWNFLGAYFIETKVDRVYHEAPLPIAVMAEIGATDDTVQLLRGVAAIIELAAAAHEIPCGSWKVQEARQAVTGQGRYKRGEAKAAVMRYCRLLGLEPENDNEGDAIVGWYYESSLLNPRTALLTTPLFGGSRVR